MLASFHRFLRVIASSSCRTVYDFDGELGQLDAATLGDTPVHLLPRTPYCEAFGHPQHDCRERALSLRIVPS